MGSSFFFAVTVALLATIAGTTAAAYNDARRVSGPKLSPAVRKDIDEAIIDALENLRAEMKTGDATLGIPPLEPFHLARLNFDIKETIAVAKGFLTNLTVTHLSEFKIITIKNDMKNLKAFFKFTLPLIKFTGHYNVSGRVIDALDIYGDGDFWLTLTDLTPWGNVTLSSEDGSEDSTIVIKTLTIDFTLGDMKGNFQNIEGGGSQGDAINSIINENGVTLVTQEKAPLTSFIQNTVIGFANKALSKYTLRQVLQYLGVEN